MHTLNLGILAHVDAGKTSLTERLLYAAGVIDEIGRVDDGSTQTDSLALERTATVFKFVTAPANVEVVIDGVSMTNARQAQARQRLRRRIQMIFQDPYASLNPRFRVDAIVSEPIRAFDLIQGERDIRSRVGELLSLVGLHPDDGNHALEQAQAVRWPSERQARRPARPRAVEPIEVESIEVEPIEVEDAEA